MVVDISPAQSATRTNFRYYIQAMQEMKISSDIPRSTAKRMAEDQLRSLVKVRTALLILKQFVCLFFNVERLNLQLSAPGALGASVPADQPGGAERTLQLEGQPGVHRCAPG